MQPDFSTKHTARVKTLKYIAQHLCEQTSMSNCSSQSYYKTQLESLYSVVCTFIVVTMSCKYVFPEILSRWWILGRSLIYLIRIITLQWMTKDVFSHLENAEGGRQKKYSTKGQNTKADWWNFHKLLSICRVWSFNIIFAN